ncbi:MAG: DnaJ domain-containing protein [Candidatus Moeniiplasma glomeromycotorum]|nr:DnaJ domain-containing protein [Candidatus Moeniiplasma glomeromycotorum]MCE8168040.1 DnaJ domain-containing protein [Candidatus Moeniiplasma glomeromycotorum]MCE8169557.1 DnaJ domain-containing protein [Candidatus Moeniiplasma glomeromycotorum]
MSKKYYEILGVSETAALAEIKKAYKNLALQHHPDKGGSEEEFKKIVEAYEVLSDPSSRAEYDKTGSAPSKGSHGGIGGVPSEYVWRSYRRIEKYANDNLTEKSKRDFDSYEEGWVEISTGKAGNWKWAICGVLENKERVLDYERATKEQIDKIKAIDDRLNDDLKRNEEKWKEHERKNQDWQDNFKDKNYSPNNGNDKRNGKKSPTSDKITQLKRDIEELRGNVDNPKLTEKEKAVIREKLSRFEKELAILENQSNNQDKGQQNQDQSSWMPPKPTPEEVKSAKDKLEEAAKSNNKEDIKQALNEASETVKNSSDPDLKKRKEQAEDNLGKIDPAELRKIIQEEIAKELQKFGIKAGDLSPENKRKLDELNNNNIKPAEVKQARTEVLNEAGIKVLENLILQLEQALKQGQKKKIKNSAEALQRFVGNNFNEYIQNAYNSKKALVQELLKRAEIQSSQQEKNNKFPTKWVVGIGGGVLVIGLMGMLIAKKKRRKGVIDKEK